jgi:hypothetical protein
MCRENFCEELTVKDRRIRLVEVRRIRVSYERSCLIGITKVVIYSRLCLATVFLYKRIHSLVHVSWSVA